MQLTNPNLQEMTFQQSFESTFQCICCAEIRVSFHVLFRFILFELMLKSISQLKKASSGVYFKSGKQLSIYDCLGYLIKAIFFAFNISNDFCQASVLSTLPECVFTFSIYKKMLEYMVGKKMCSPSLYKLLDLTCILKSQYVIRTAY